MSDIRVWVSAAGWCDGGCRKRVNFYSVSLRLNIPIVFPFFLVAFAEDETKIGTDRFSFNFSRVSIYCCAIKINTTLLAEKTRAL